MSLVDDIFKSIPLEILTDFGQDITLVKTVTPRTYDPSTGTTTGADTTVTTKGFIGNVSSRESDGLYQTTDVKITVSGDDLDNYYPTQADPLSAVPASLRQAAKPVSFSILPQQFL